MNRVTSFPADSTYSANPSATPIGSLSRSETEKARTMQSLAVTAVAKIPMHTSLFLGSGLGTSLS
jgi:hypothetical protein